MGEPRTWDKFVAESGIKWEFGQTEVNDVWRMEYLGEPYKESIEEERARLAAEEWMRVPEMFVSATQMRYIADKHKTTVREMREHMRKLSRPREDYEG